MTDVLLDPVAMRNIERIVITIIGAFFGYLGFRLFRLGITHGSATVSGEGRWGKLLFSGTAPGLFFMFVGGAVVAIALLTGGGQTSQTTRKGGAPEGPMEEIPPQEAQPATDATETFTEDVSANETAGVTATAEGHDVEPSANNEQDEDRNTMKNGPNKHTPQPSVDKVNTSGSPAQSSQASSTEAETRNSGIKSTKRGLRQRKSEELDVEDDTVTETRTRMRKD